jgi:hypothetical protein
VSPTATHAVADRHETPLSCWTIKLSLPALGRSDHFVPFQRSTRFFRTRPDSLVIVRLTLVDVPTATQA